LKFHVKLYRTALDKLENAWISEAFDCIAVLRKIDDDDDDDDDTPRNAISITVYLKNKVLKMNIYRNMLHSNKCL
jgi:hypothetical protein